MRGSRTKHAPTTEYRVKPPVPGTATLMVPVTGIVLAAGAGTRMGTPKALKITADADPWVARAARLLRASGCDPVIVVLGAEAVEAARLVPLGVETVIARDWAGGMSASVRTALAAVHGTAALITLVDLPAMPVSVAQRVLNHTAVSARSLCRATYFGSPGHPVLIGRDHFSALAKTIDGDHGAGRYLRQHGVTKIECGDLFDGIDHDTPEP